MENSLKGGRDSAVGVGEEEKMKAGVYRKISINIEALKNTVDKKPTTGLD